MPDAARSTVRECLRAVRPDLDVGCIADDAPLLERRVINSFQVIELLVHLEQAAGARIERSRLVAGSFRDIATIARVFLQEGEGV